MINPPTHPLPTHPQPALPPRGGYCATCGAQTLFTFLGEQRWPAPVAAAAGVSQVVYLWTCRTCQTTVTETIPQ